MDSIAQKVMPVVAIVAVAALAYFFQTGELTFTALLLDLTILTGVYWVWDHFWLAPQRNARAKAEVARFEADNAEAIARGEPAVVAEKKAIYQRYTQQPTWVEYTAGFFPVILAVFIFRSFMFEPFRIPSGSMRPTLETGDFILVNKFGYGLRFPVFNFRFTPGADPARGDVIVFHYPLDTRVDYIKRIVGLPGDTVRYENKAITINGKRVAEKRAGTYLEPEYSKEIERYEECLGKGHQMVVDQDRASDVPVMAAFTHPNACRHIPGGMECKVPKDHYMVFGDNRDNSADSRYWGFVPSSNIVGRAFMVFLHINAPSLTNPSSWWKIVDFSRVGFFR